MDREELEAELKQVETKMQQVGKDTRAYRAGQIIKIAIENQLAAMEDK